MGTLRSFAAIASSAVVMLVLGLSGTAHARPWFGGTCSNCHGDVREDVFQLTGASGTSDPAGGIGDLAYFIAQPGSNVDLTVNVTDGANRYAVALVDAFSNPGLFPEQGGPGSTTWTFVDGFPAYFYIDPQTDNAAHTFTLAVPAGTAQGFYPFNFTVAGPGTGDRWHVSENFYVRVVPEVGTLALLSAGLGAVGIVVVRRRRRKFA